MDRDEYRRLENSFWANWLLSHGLTKEDIWGSAELYHQIQQDFHKFRRLLEDIRQHPIQHVNCRCTGLPVGVESVEFEGTLYLVDTEPSIELGGRCSTCGGFAKIFGDVLVCEKCNGGNHD